jgi:hypothetical protein
MSLLTRSSLSAGVEELLLEPLHLLEVPQLEGVALGDFGSRQRVLRRVRTCLLLLELRGELGDLFGELLRSRARSRSFSRCSAASRALSTPSLDSPLALAPRVANLASCSFSARTSAARARSSLSAACCSSFALSSARRIAAVFRATCSSTSTTWISVGPVPIPHVRLLRQRDNRFFQFRCPAVARSNRIGPVQKCRSTHRSRASSVTVQKKKKKKKKKQGKKLFSFFLVLMMKFFTFTRYSRY